MQRSRRNRLPAGSYTEDQESEDEVSAESDDEFVEDDDRAEMDRFFFWT